MSRNYDFSLGASGGASQQLVQAVGTRCKLISSTAGAVLVRTNTGDIYDLLPGQGFDARDGKPFSELVVVNLAGAASVGVLFVGDSFFRDDRITGDVNIIDNAAAKTGLGLQFVGSTAQVGLPGVVSLAALVAGVRTLSIRRMAIYSSVSGHVLLTMGTGAPLATPTNQGPLRNKLSSGASSGAAKWSAQAAATVPTVGELPGVSQLGYWYVQANDTAEIALTTPILLAPGHAIAVTGPAANAYVQLFVDAEEL